VFGKAGEMGEKGIPFVGLVVALLVAICLPIGCSGNSSNAFKETNTTRTTTVEADPSGNTPAS